MSCCSETSSDLAQHIGGLNDPIPPLFRARSQYRIRNWHNRILEIPVAHAHVLGG